MSVRGYNEAKRASERLEALFPASSAGIINPPRRSEADKGKRPAGYLLWDIRQPLEGTALWFACDLEAETYWMENNQDEPVSPMCTTLEQLITWALVTGHAKRRS